MGKATRDHLLNPKSCHETLSVSCSLAPLQMCGKMVLISFVVGLEQTCPAAVSMS